MNGRSAFAPALVIMTLLVAGAEFLFRYESAPLEDAGWLLGDCVAYRDIARSLLSNGSVDYRLVNGREARRYTDGGKFTRSATRSTISLTVDGRLVPKHTVLFAAVLVPAYALLGEAGLLIFNWAQCALLVVLAYWLSTRYFSPPVGFAAAAAFLIDGMLGNYTYNVSPDIFGAVLVLGGTLWVWRPGSSRLGSLGGGVLLGLAVWMRPTNLIGLAALSPLVVTSLRRREADARPGYALAGFAVGVSGFLLLNAFWFGSPFTTSYDRVAILNDGVLSTASHRADFNRPFWPSILPTLLTDKQGFLLTAPHWPLVLPALFYLLRRRATEAMALAALVFGPVIVLLKYDHWQSSHFGNRFLFLPAAVSALGVAWLVQMAANRFEADAAERPAEGPGV